MIITKQRSIEELLKMLDEPVFIIGCSECATLCHTGGEKEVLEMKNALEEKGIEVSGWVVLDPACHLQNDKKLLRAHRKEIERAKVILALSCGNGIQTVSEILDVRIVAGTDTLFLGEIKRVGEFEERCVMCGECIADVLGGICPIARCPKSMLNGPCGGSREGKCEVDVAMDCVWHLIYERLIKMNQLKKIEEIQLPKDWSRMAGRGNTWRI